MADKAFEQYGYVATLARTIPELRSLLTRALAHNWSTDEFSRNVQDSKWWKNSADSVKQFQILKATKPGEFAQQRSQLVTRVRAMAGQLGVSLGEGRGSLLGAVVDQAMKFGWDDQQIQLQIGKYWKYHRGQTSSGQAGAFQQQIREIRSQYGLGVNEDSVARTVYAILSGRQTSEGYKAQMAAAAKSRYPSFAQQIDAGQTLQEIADPYIQTMAQTLELNPSDIGLNDPHIQRALTMRNPQNGEPAAMPLWQLQDLLRQDKRYDHTTQAVNDAYSVLGEIGRGWGFKA